MTLQNVLSLLGGLALFLYGMHMMSVGLETAAGDRMKAILEKLTSNRLLGVAVGAGITAVIQSSSAEPGSLDHHGSQYRNNDYRAADCFGCLPDRTAGRYHRGGDGNLSKGEADQFDR